MTIDGDHGGERSEAAARRTGRRRRVAVVGSAGLAVVLGGGAYLISTSGGGGSTAAGEVAAPAPVGALSAEAAPGGGSTATTDPVRSDVASSGTVSPAPASSRPALSGSGSPAGAARSAGEAGAVRSAGEAGAVQSDGEAAAKGDAAVKKEIQAARDAAARDGHPLLPAIIPTGPAAAASTRTEQTTGGTIRITTARADLTGQQGQQLAADDGTPAADAHCTRRLHFSNAAKPEEVPSLLLCWRTSAKRSVVTLAVAKRGRPSAADSAAVIDREWAKLS